jgi:hypothetical protein
MFNLELGQVELGLRAGEKPDAGSGLGEAEREALAYASAGARDEDAFIV